MLIVKFRGLAAALIACAISLSFLLVDAAFNDAQALKPRGAWSASVTYALDDLVILRGSTWRSKHANNKGKLPGRTTPSTAADWELFAAGLNPIGAWISTRAYHRSDLVVRLGSTFRALRTNLNKIPGQSAGDWQLFAAKGATGPQGAPGSTAVANGSAAAPAFRFTSSPDTGIFSPGGGKLAIAENGQLLFHAPGFFNLALGLGALANVDADVASSNTAVGFNALMSDTTGFGNTGVGESALGANTDGSNNTALGESTLRANTSGSTNVAVGSFALRSNTTGADNTAVGMNALFANTTGTNNSALGRSALQSNTTGVNNTAVGAQALKQSTGNSNTAVGNLAMQVNSTGSRNTALGDHALFFNDVGSDNTAVGYEALQDNTASSNTAVGSGALGKNTTGTQSTAVGVNALPTNTAGGDNTAVGFQALFGNTAGDNNTAVGLSALSLNSEGDNNTALGLQALFGNQTGSNNIAIGVSAASNTQNPANSIFIGNSGSSGDTATIKIGTQSTQTSAFIAGIWGAATGGDAVAVVIDSTGKLGTAVSSRRYKEDIRPMGAMSAILAQLRPVSFRYIKPYADGSKPIEYGLIAEEVAEIFPYLAVFNEHGQPETVKYHLLPTFLLAGYQEQQRIIAAQAETIADQQNAIDAQAERMAALETRLHSIEAMLQPPTITTASDAR